MNNYIVQGKIATGVLANVYRISKKESPNTQLVLKEVECPDLNTAKATLEELKIFHELDHRFLCKLRDSFLKWDKPISTIYVCYLMDSFEKGSLTDYLNEKRLNYEIVNFNLIQDWIANMTEVIYYLHRMGIVHRNIKPGSFYLHPINGRNQQRHQDAYELILGDYCVLTMIRDARTKTRISPVAFDYTAPEVIDAQSFTYKSDMWSLGATLFDVCTTSNFNDKDLHLNLINIRHDEELKLSLIDLIQDTYHSKSLTNALRLLLNTNADQRVNIKSFANNEYIQECLELIGSDLDIYGHTSDKMNHKLPENQSFETLLGHLETNLTNESLTLQTISRLDHQLADETEEATKILDKRIQHLIVKILKVHSNSKQIQLAVFRLLDECLHIILKPSNKIDWNRDNVFESHFVEQLFYNFLKYDQNEKIQLHGLNCISSLSNFNNVSKQLAKYDATHFLFKQLTSFESNAIICAHVCKAIWYLSTNDHINRKLCNKKALLQIRNVLERHASDEFCVEMAIKSIVAICTNERLVYEEIDADLISVMLSAFQSHLDSSKVVEAGCIAFSSLINMFEACAYRFISMSSRDDQLDGIELLRLAYSDHKDESRVVESICNVIQELSAYDDILNEMHLVRLHETLLDEISKRYRENHVISDKCFYVISKIVKKSRQDNLDQD